MPANRDQHVGELARLGQSQVSIVGGVPAEPSNGGTLEQERVVVADQQDEAERIGQVDVSELGRGGEREVCVPGLEGAAELRVSVALRAHGRGCPTGRRTAGQALR
jgi:hypothetical protein